MSLDATPDTREPQVHMAVTANMRPAEPGDQASPHPLGFGRRMLCIPDELAPPPSDVAVLDDCGIYAWWLA